MMEKSSFFNAELVGEEYDRTYLAEDYARYFASFIGNGVFPNPSNNLQVIADGTSMNVSLSMGKAWINGYFYNNTDDLILTIIPADGVLNRIDRVVLRLDFLNREIKCYVKKGVFASTPMAPSLQRDADMFEIGIADVAVNKGAIAITQSNITDLRLNNSYCGVVHGVVDQVDTTAIFNQFQSWYSQTKSDYDTDISVWTTEKKAAFDIWYTTNTTDFLNQFDTWYDNNTTQWSLDFITWFNSIKGQLSGDLGTNLQNQINELAGTGRTTETVKKNADDITALSQKVTSQLGEMTSLQTTVKTNLVGAVNEVNTNKVAKNDYVANNAFATTSGTSTAYTITLNPVPTAYVDGMQITILPHTDCGINPTLKVNTLTALTIVKQDGSAIASGDIKANKPLSLVRVGTNFFIRSGGGGSNIKSIQRGTYIMTSATAYEDISVSSVNPANSIILVSIRTTNSVSNKYSLVNPTIVNSTTIRLERYEGSTTEQAIMYWQVIEFNNVKSKQSGLTGTLSYDVSIDIPITTVNTNKSFLVSNVILGNSSGNILNPCYLKTDSIITAQNYHTANTIKIGWQLIEFN